jgi:hypothetical protein
MASEVIVRVMGERLLTSEQYQRLAESLQSFSSRDGPSAKTPLRNSEMLSSPSVYHSIP